MKTNNHKNFVVRDLRGKERFVVDNKFLDNYARFVGVYAVGVYSSLCRHANKQQKMWPSIKKLCEELNVGKNKIIESIKYLEFWNIIVKKRIGLKCTNRYFLIKKTDWKIINENTLWDFSKVYNINFRSLPHKLQEFTTRSSIVRKHNSKETHSKDIILLYKDNNISKQEVCDKSLDEINKIFRLFYDTVNPAINFGNKTHRVACQRLVKKFGLEKVINATKYAIKIQYQKFSPTITNPYQLENKWGELVAFRLKNKNNKINIII